MGENKKTGINETNQTQVLPQYPLHQLYPSVTRNMNNGIPLLEFPYPAGRAKSGYF
jgi:hypothetical protein